MANNDWAIVAALDAARAIFRAHVEHERGRIVDTAGESGLAEFDTVSGTVRAALSIQGELEVQNPTTTESQRLRFRIGIEMGEVIHKEDGSIYGAGVNVAARLQTIAAPGSVVVSEDARRQIKPYPEFLCSDLGEHEFKHVSEPPG